MRHDFAMQWSRRLYARADLHILREATSRLSETPYFNKKLEKYSLGLIELISHILDKHPPYPEDFLRFFNGQIWVAHKYLRGSISREVPYELEFALGVAVKEWIKRDCVITMFLGVDKDFHFFPVDPWEVMKRLTIGFSYSDFDSLLIQVALPRLYREKPIFNIPLYHELGHFVDTHYGITDYSLIIQPPTGGNPDQEKRHRAEFFADVFAAQYVGITSIELLEAYVGNQPASTTHPATSDRRKISEDFVAGAANALVDTFKQALSKQGAPTLQLRRSAPPIAAAYDNMRPYSIPNASELHGLFGASWSYLNAALAKTHPTWASLDESTIERVINDLTEKSIRNMSLREKWANGSSP